MKKTVSILFSILLCISALFAGCSGKLVAVPESFDADLNGQVVFDEDGVVVKALGFSKADKNSPGGTLYFCVENNTDETLNGKNLGLSVSMFYYVDNCKMDSINSFICPTIKSGKTADASLAIDSESLDSYGIKNIGTVSLYFSLSGKVVSADDPEPEMVDIVLSDSPERLLNTENAILDNENYYIAVVSGSDGKEYSSMSNAYGMSYYVENRTDRAIDVEEVRSVNGVELSEHSPLTVEANSCAFGGYDVAFPYTPSGENEVLFEMSDVKTLGITVKIYDGENSDLIAESEYYEIAVD